MIPKWTGWIHLATLIAAIGITSQPTPVSASSIPASVKEATKRALDAIRAQKIGVRIENPGAPFTAALDDLANDPGPSLPELAANEGASIEAKLVAIALDRKSRLERYAEIEDYYSTAYRHVVGRPARRRSLQPEHYSDDDRLIWEYMSLSPRARWYRQEALGLVRTYGSPSSIIVFRTLCSILTEDPMAADSTLQRELTVVLGKFMYFPREDSLRGMLECVQLRIEQVRRFEAIQNPRSPQKTYDLSKRFVELFSGTGEFAGHRWRDDDAWRPIVQNFPRSGLTEEQLELLNKISAAYGL